MTEPLLLWLDGPGRRLVNRVVREAAYELAGDAANGMIDTGNGAGNANDEVPTRAFVELLAALGEHSVEYVARWVASARVVMSTQAFAGTSPRTRGELIQHFLGVVLSLTVLPYDVEGKPLRGAIAVGATALVPSAAIFNDVGGVRGEALLAFWYQLQEEVWGIDWEEDTEVEGDGARDIEERGYYWGRSRPERLRPCTRYTVDLYRRDVGDTLINAYYVLRDDMLAYYVDDALQRLAAPVIEWEGAPRVQRTALVLLDTYAAYLGHPAMPPATLPGTLEYATSALREPQLSLAAANALRSICDANCAILASCVGVGAFGSVAEMCVGRVATSRSILSGPANAEPQRRRESRRRRAVPFWEPLG
ncbi:hypothetical protein HDZ31DRAFT_77079 [Schizophyllum fasciatum]